MLSWQLRAADAWAVCVWLKPQFTFAKGLAPQATTKTASWNNNGIGAKVFTVVGWGNCSGGGKKFALVLPSANSDHQIRQATAFTLGPLFLPRSSPLLGTLSQVWGLSHRNVVSPCPTGFEPGFHQPKSRMVGETELHALGQFESAGGQGRGA